MYIIIPTRSENGIDNMVSLVHKEFPNAKVIVSSNRPGKGKGWAIREGLKYVEDETMPVCYIDGDLDIHPKEIHKLLPKLCLNDVVLGKKALPAMLQRRIVTFFSRLFIGILFNIWYDTQTGVKIFRNKRIIPDYKEDGFAFELEIFNKVNKNKLKVAQVDVDVSIRKKMPIKSIINFIIQAIKIRLCK